MTDKLGPTGEFPEGKMNEHDEGEIRMGLCLSNGRVVIDFGKPVQWVAFSPSQAREIADALWHKAAQAMTMLATEEPKPGERILS